MSALNSEFGRLRREKADVEAKVRQLQKGVIPPETAYLIDNLEREKTEWKDKYTYLRDRYDVSLCDVCKLVPEAILQKKTLQLHVVHYTP